MNFECLQKYLENMVENNISPSVDCIVKKDRKIIFRFFKGYRDIENKIVINGNEEYLIFSMTKLFTCVCALQLFEQGKYSLDDPIKKYLPEFSKMLVVTSEKTEVNQNDIASGNSFGEVTTNNALKLKETLTPITVRQLFSMGAGFNYNLNSKNILDAIDKGCNDTKSIVSSLSKAPLEFEPGTHFRYSLCHDVLGALIEIWSEKSLGDYLFENVCKPLGLKHTYFSKRDNFDNPNLSSIYHKNSDGCFKKSSFVNPYTLVDGYQSGGAGLISCTEDYSIFLDALANDGVADKGYLLLKKETIDLMKTNQLNEQQYLDFQELLEGYGYGLGVRTHMNSNVSGSLSPVGEFGWDGAAGAFSIVDSKNHISLTYFQHCFNWDKAIHQKIRNLLYQSME